MGYELFAMTIGVGDLALAPVPGADGDLQADVAAIAQWGATLVISATETEEMQNLGAGELPRALQEAGIDWVHFPVRDFGVPKGDMKVQWVEVAASALEQLQAGARILVHCRGGCGRSGMLVLQLMIEAGMAEEEALQQLRAVRPCAVETDEQMVWASKGVLTHA